MIRERLFRLAGLVLQRASGGRNSFDPPGPQETRTEHGARVTANLRYGTEHPNSFLDVYLAEDGAPGSRPTVVVVHGGGFIAGSKDDGDPRTSKAGATYWALGHGTLLTAGWNVVCINYGLAPQVPYPTAVRQLGQALEFLREHAQELGLDMSRIVLSGGSAGGHIIGQYAIAQSSPGYAESLGVEPMHDPAALRAMLLDSAPFDARRGGRTRHPKLLNNILFGISVRAYLRSSPVRLDQADLIAHVTAAFPPAVIADGNTGTFPDQATDFAERLTELGVEHELVLYPRSEAELGHGFMAEPSRWTDDYNARKLAFLQRVLDRD